MKQLIKSVLDRLPYIESLRKQIRNQGRYPAGHYHSPIPNHNDVMEYIKSPKRSVIELTDINLNKESQFKLLQEYYEYYDSLPFPEQKEPGSRYYYSQTWFCYADAIFLYSFLRKNKPKRIIEVGSGYSSAVILDTVGKFFDQPSEITCIEPYPDRLMSVLEPHDKEKIQILDKKVQDLPSEFFTSLRQGDLLFIDSSHVVKCGSDLQFIMFEILPKLEVGVYVHFHDIFFPFEYPAEWLAMGRYWNESYFLRAFLANNNQWEISFFNTYVAIAFKDFLEDRMPLCLKNSGGSIYIQKIDEG